MTRMEGEPHGGIPCSRARRNMSHRVKKLNAKVRSTRTRNSQAFHRDTRLEGATRLSQAPKEGKGRQVEVHTSEEDERDDDARLLKYSGRLDGTKATRRA